MLLSIQSILVTMERKIALADKSYMAAREFGFSVCIIKNVLSHVLESLCLLCPKEMWTNLNKMIVFGTRCCLLSLLTVSCYFDDVSFKPVSRQIVFKAYVFYFHTNHAKSLLLCLSLSFHIHRPKVHFPGECTQHIICKSQWGICSVFFNLFYL